MLSPDYATTFLMPALSASFMSCSQSLAVNMISRIRGAVAAISRATSSPFMPEEGESVENALQAENIISEVKRHSYYLKPGEKRRLKQALARKRARKKLRKDFSE